MKAGAISAARRAVQKARGRSLAELRDRTRQFVSAELEYRGLSSSAREPTDADFWRRIRPSVARSVDQDQKRLHDFLKESSRARFFPGVADLDATVEFVRTTSPDLAAGTLAAADRVVAGAFDLLGYTALSFGTPIDWHLDPTMGVRSPRWHWSRIKYLNASVVGDHKVVWEINRHQYFMILGRAYALTGDERYATTFVQHATSWMDENPPSVGVNWASSLEVSFRLISWLWAFELFRDSPKFTAALRFRMLKFLHAHATHIECFLSTYFSPNTHLTGEALGLWYAGNLLSFFEDSDRWSRTGWSILTTQIERQVHADGVYFEQATYYHRYTVDIFTHAVLLARASGRDVPTGMLERLDSLVDHLADLTRPDGSIPLIGDDDGGRLVALEERESSNVRAAIGTAAVLFERPKYATVAAGIPQETVWLVGPERAAILKSLHDGKVADGSRAFASGGFVVFRDGWSTDSNHAVIDFGPHGTANCGHAHADALSIDLSCEGAPLFVDPGTFSYTGSLADRDYFRSSRSHNTLTIDDASSSETSGPFSWITKTDSQLDAWWSTDWFDYFSGSHTGFERLAEGAVHQRRVFFVKRGYWVIWDCAEVAREADVAVHFHAAPGTDAKPIDDHQAFLTRTRNGEALRSVFAVYGTGRRIHWESDWVSECYGRRVEAPVCRIVSRGAGRHDFVSIVAPTTRSPELRVTQLAMDNGYGVAVIQRDWVDIVAVRTKGVLSGESMLTDADFAWVRRSSDGGPVTAVALCGGRSLRYEDVTLNRASIGNAEARRTFSGWVADGGEIQTSGRVSAVNGRAAGTR